MLDAALDIPDADADESLVGKIPIRNVWLLFLYASGLAQFSERFEAEVEESPDLKSLIARLLCFAVEKRLRRNLSFGYRRRNEVLKRIRGRIDILKTVSEDLFRRGEVACRFDELTIDTPRNRLVRAALARLSSIILDDADLSHHCRTLANDLGRVGVSGKEPTRSEMAADQIARHEGDDRLMVSLARAVFDLVLPMEAVGSRSIPKAQREEAKFRKLFEKAISNFFASELSRDDGWRVYPGKQFSWPITSSSRGFSTFMPIMITDIILENEQVGRRIIIDTKFTGILAKSKFETERFKTDHLYQLYTYLRSQEKINDPLSENCEGWLIYPSMGINIDETAKIQGHNLRMVTIDLSLPSDDIIRNLQRLPFISRLLQNDDVGS
ncbi:5-methylcytosine-specific restriction endonuclease system specificity protein McrC [Sphingobium naphthae]|uniref:5-methylcytosine-specific restriction endonuclease system specificity protein McrC n=1 Tax=Sphingobium naphthae TaxID=1886786 RepID=UPI00374821A1